MKSLKSGTQVRSCILHLVFATLLIMLSACGSSTSDSNDSSSDTGSIAFRLVLQNTTSQRSVVPKQATNICTVGVSEVKASVLTADDTELKSGGPWDCDLHEGTINEVPAQSNLTLLVQCMSSKGNILYEGRKTVTVRPGEKTQETVPLTRLGSRLWDEMFWDQDKWG